MYTEDSVLEVKQKATILEVVEDFVVLKPQGGSYIGLCPFHKERTPSFHVHPTKGIFKCFGCGLGGDALAFLQEQNLL